MQVCCLTEQEDQIQHCLTPGMVYAVLGIEAGDYRIIDDCGQPLLFPAKLFQVIDSNRRSEWVSTSEDGVEYAYPPELNDPGFFETYFAGEPEARRIFAQHLNRLLSQVA